MRCWLVSGSANVGGLGKEKSRKIECVVGWLVGIQALGGLAWGNCASLMFDLPKFSRRTNCGGSAENRRPRRHGGSDLGRAVPDEFSDIVFAKGGGWNQEQEGYKYRQLVCRHWYK